MSGGGFADGAIFLIASLMVLSGFLLLYQGLRTTPFSGSDVFWRTRPLSSGAVFVSKTLFVVLAVVVPYFVGSWMGIRALGFTGDQTLRAILFAGLPILVLIGAAATLCAISGDRRTLLRNGVIVVGAGFAAAVLARIMVGSIGVPWEEGHGGLHPFVESQIRNQMVLLATAGLVLVSWFLTPVRRGRGAFVMVLIGICLAPFLRMVPFPIAARIEPLPEGKVAIQLLRPDAGREVWQGSEQVLWSHFAVRDLPERRLLWPELLEADFEADTPAGTVGYESKGGVYYRVRPSEIQARLAPRYPEGTEWSLPSDPILPGLLSREGATVLVNGANLEGRLEGRVAGLEIEMKPAATLILKPGANAVLNDGGRVRVDSIEKRRGTIEVKLTTETPQWIIDPDRDPEAAGMWQGQEWQRELPTAVLYREEAGTAVMVNTSRSGHSNAVLGPADTQRYRFRFPVPTLEMAQSGLAFEAWLASAQLDLYLPQPVSRFSHSFVAEAYPDVTLTFDSPLQEQSGSLGSTEEDGREISRGESELLERFLFGQAPRNRRQWKEEIENLSADDFAEIASIVPAREELDDVFFLVAPDRIGDLSDEILLSGLDRSLRFLPVCREAGLDNRALPLVAERMNRRVPLDGKSATEALRFLAEKGEETVRHESLRWHFVHSDPDQRSAGDALESMEGFDFKETVEEAWRFATANVSGETWQLGPFALPLGEKEALRASLARLRGDCAEWERKRLERKLAETVAAPSGEEPVTWAEANFDSIVFDAKSGRFVKGDG